MTQRATKVRRANSREREYISSAAFIECPNLACAEFGNSRKERL